MREYLFRTEEEFLEKLKEMVRSGAQAKDITVVMPYPVHEVEEILHPRPSSVKYFTFVGALSGLITGFAFTIYTVLRWGLITGGKPLVSIPPFIIIAFELTILFGALATFFGFLLLSRLPSLGQIIEPREYENQFVILVRSGEAP
jgi:molybdopterin-containing oxidoreductase family membrane subunit